MGHVVFRKQVSDGNYGSETAEVLLDLPEGVDKDEFIKMLEVARQLVHDELRKSPAWRVRDDVTPSDQPTAVTVPPDDEDLPY
jgi:hypothetical protein